jgi:hypothetical protein
MNGSRRCGRSKVLLAGADSKVEIDSRHKEGATVWLTVLSTVNLWSCVVRSVKDRERGEGVRLSGQMPIGLIWM